MEPEGVWEEEEEGFRWEGRGGWATERGYGNGGLRLGLKMENVEIRYKVKGLNSK